MDIINMDNMDKLAKYNIEATLNLKTAHLTVFPTVTSLREINRHFLSPFTLMSFFSYHFVTLFYFGVIGLNK
jgi:hypothetical protein